VSIRRRIWQKKEAPKRCGWEGKTRTGVTDAGSAYRGVIVAEGGLHDASGIFRHDVWM